MTAAARGLDYAERELGVHSIYQDARNARQRMLQVTEELDRARRDKRELDEKLLDKEMEILAVERGNHPSMSQAAFDRHIKEARHVDVDMRVLRAQVRVKLSEIDAAESQLRLAEVDVRIAVARLEELSGYLSYLAQLKRAQMDARPQVYQADQNTVSA